MKTIFCLLLGTFLVGTAFAEESSTQQCVELLRVNLDDDRVMDEQQQKKLFKQYIGRCIDGKLLKEVIADVSGFYINQGNITTKPYLKKQSIADGQIEISVLKGSVENIVDVTTKTSNSRIKTAFAFQKGKILNLRDLETALEMMNRPPSSDAKFEIKPGQKQGASIIEVKSNDSSPYHLQLGVTGRNNLSDKNLVLTGEASVDNPLNINDILTFRLNGSRVQKEFQSDRVAELNYSFPIASYLMELIGSYSSYRQGVDGLADTFLASGDTKGIRLRVSKVLMRDQKNKLNAALSIFHKDTNNFFSNQRIDVSSQKTTLAQFDLTHTWLQNRGRVITVYSYYQGTNWLGARDDSFFATAGTGDQARLQFRKHSLDLNLLYYLTEGRSYQFTSNFHLQRTNDLLFDNDKLIVGSDYTVRGYLDRSLIGNNAWYVRNDVTKTWAPNVHHALLQTVSLFAGLDYGNVGCEADNRSSCGKIYGSALGFGTDAKNLSTSFVWSRPLKKLNANFKLNNLFKLDVIWKF